MNNRVFNSLNTYTQAEINRVLDKEELATLESYITELENDNNNLEEENNDLRYELEQLKNEREIRVNEYKKFLSDVIKDKYLGVHRMYNTLESLMNKIEFVEHYGYNY